MGNIEQAGLFEENGESAGGGYLDVRAVAADLGELYELSADAYYAAVYARMSGLPLEAEISRFTGKIRRAGDRAAAGKAASDRGDPDTLAVLKAAWKVQHEIHRITGFLRFSPDTSGVYTARCAPDYFILPALAEHFTLRFGETPWAIIDGKRGLCLSRKTGGEARLFPLPQGAQGGAVPAGSLPPAGDAPDRWETLWKLYHRSVNNGARANPALQRQFIPERYRKYMNEFS